MADLQTSYVLTTPGPDITFNSGTLKDGTDKYWITNILGLDGAPQRNTVDKVPFADGAIIHTSWKDARHIVFEGVLVTESVGFPSFGDACITVQNTMEENLRQALESIIAANGTLAWTPLGQGARSLTVRSEVELQMSAIENYALKQFTFGLIAADPDW